MTDYKMQAEAAVLKSNNPPPAILGPATFVLKRVSGEIEIRGLGPEYLSYEQANHPDYIFEEHVQLRESRAMEIRGATLDSVQRQQVELPDYVFGEPLQIGDGLWSVQGVSTALWAVKGRKAHSLSAAFNKINLFSQDLCRLTHDFHSGGLTYNGELSNTATVATNHLYSDISANEVASGGGYTTGGSASTMSDSSTTGVETVSAASITWTGSGGGMGPFRYVTMYTTSTAVVSKPLVCWFDYGTSISLNPGDTFQVSWASGFFTVT